MQPSEPVLSPDEWKQRNEWHITRWLRSGGPHLKGSPPRIVCPRCGERMREVAGFDDYCPQCRQREELLIEREAVAVGKIAVTGWLEGWDVPHSE